MVDVDCMNHVSAEDTIVDIEITLLSANDLLFDINGLLLLSNQFFIENLKIR